MIDHITGFRASNNEIAANRSIVVDTKTDTVAIILNDEIVGTAAALSDATAISGTHEIAAIRIRSAGKPRYAIACARG